MNLKQTLKLILVGFFFGVGIIWLLSAIIPMTMGYSCIKFIHACIKDISSMSMLSGGVCSMLWPLLAVASRKRRKREELEDAMTEYFRKQAEKD